MLTLHNFCGLHTCVPLLLLLHCGFVFRMYWFTTVKGSVEITVFDNPQKVKGQLSIFIVKQAVMVEVQQLILLKFSLVIFLKKFC